MRVIKAALVALVRSLGFAAPVGAGQLEDAAAAYHQGDYAAALRLWRPLAEQGDAQAQFSLGYMYRKGQGVTQDHAEAVKWFRKAAEQGHLGGQNNLGLMYAKGDGVPEDHVLAHMWLNLAASKGNEHATKVRDIAAGTMTPAQIAEAQKLAREWRPASER